jgi:hypothetical protein
MTGVLSPICGARSRCRIIRSSHFSSQKQSCELAHQRILFRRFGRFAFFRPFSTQVPQRGHFAAENGNVL